MTARGVVACVLAVLALCTLGAGCELRPDDDRYCATACVGRGYVYMPAQGGCNATPARCVCAGAADAGAVSR